MRNSFFIMVALCLISVFLTSGCGRQPLPKAPTNIFFCSQDSDCEIGAVCLNHVCVDGERKQQSPEVTPEDGGHEQPELHPEPQPETQPELQPEKALCKKSEQQPCYPPQTKGCEKAASGYNCKGSCVFGYKTCELGKWSDTCYEAVTPREETCGDMLDNDCDGIVDNPSKCNECKDGETKPCYTGPAGTKNVGICKEGLKHCKDGKWETACTGETTPQKEICDTLDNDCNGQVDEIPECSKQCKKDEQRPCYSGTKGCKKNGGGKYVCLGTCSAGAQICDGQGNWGPCISEVLPSPETCDGKNNNCDGQTDENLTQPCYTGPQGTSGKGACKAGVRTCTAGTWGKCEKEILPKTETCDGKDNNCDGFIDENLTRPCFDGASGCTKQSDGSFKCTGTCKAGTEKCVQGKWSGVCSNEQKPETEVCDGKDNNCDGQVDELPQKECYTGPANTKNVGICKAGTQECKKGAWTVCNDVTPQTEICDGVDNNCNGKTDESSSCICKDGETRSCYSGPAGTKDVGSCKSGTQTCANNAWGACTGEVLPDYEKCDGKDNNCDGHVDESLKKSCYTGPANTSGKGLCKTGLQTCSAGKWGACTGEVNPAKETCDNKDNDCDGQVDESLTQSCYTGPSGTAGKGVCKEGRKTCSAGRWSSCVGQVIPVAETCDNRDNDCDEQVDESLNKACYTGPSGTAGKGICKAGVQTCNAGRWSSCVGQITPKGEICGNGKDDDCNGKVDDVTCQCHAGQTLPCYSGPTGTKDKGVCNAGTKSCVNGAWGPCTGEVTPSTEICDGKDNDCDGTVNEGNLTKCPELKLVPNGTFYRADGKVITLTNKLWVSAHEVTQGAYKALMNNANPSINKASDLHPVENLTWHDAAKFCNKLSVKHKLTSCFTCNSGTCSYNTSTYYACKGYRLPTEAEWEYTARATTKGDFYDSPLSKIACHKATCGGVNAKSTKVGSFSPNLWGLYDHHGNVAEWTADGYRSDTSYTSATTDPLQPYNASDMIMRGCWFSSISSDCTAKKRFHTSPSNHRDILGFRVVRTF